jgi:hypothetical protein
MHCISPLLLAVQLPEPVGVEVAEVVVVVVLVELVALVVVVGVVDTLVVVVVLAVVVVVVEEDPPLQVPERIDATTLRSSPLSLETSQTIAPANPLQRAKLILAARETVSS